MAGLQLHKRHPHSLSPTTLAVAGWAAFVVAGLLFLAIAWNVVAREWLAELDLRVAEWLHAHSDAVRTAFFLSVSHLHSLAAIGVYSAVFAAVLARLRESY